jgi:KUP system potassium uptake protein
MMMTTILLTYYLRFKLKWNRWLVYSLFLIFAITESSFFIANVAKIRERWMFLFFELFIFLTMYIWHSARKVNNRLVRFVDIGKYIPGLKELSEDETIPKFSTHLIYLTKANNRHHVEEKIIKSIFSKKPKRADVYWFLHIHRTEDPYTLSYDITELVEEKIIKVNIQVGFRVQPRTEIYFKKIIQQLVTNKELNLHLRADGSTHYNHEPDFKFIVIEKFISIENDFALRDGLLLRGYFLLKNLGLSDKKAFGLEKTDVIVEEVPLVYTPVQQFELIRIQ